MRDERLERLDDYVRGEKRDDDDAFEADLFARALDGTASELVVLDSMAASLRGHAARGTLPNFTTAEQAEKLRVALGSRLSYIDQSANQWDISPNAELLIIRVPVDLSDVDRVDVESIVVGVGTVKTMPDVLFEKGGDALYLCCEPSLADRANTVGPVITRYWGHKAGEKRLLSETSWVVPDGL
jgi:hypothetical protein